MQFPNLKGVNARNFIAIAVLLQGTTSAPRKSRLSIADWGEAYHEHEHEGKGTYAFGYDIDDPETGNTQYRNEERHANGSVTGSYGLLEPDGNVRIVHYIADANGFRVNIVNSEKPNAEFPAPTPPLVPSQPSEEMSERPSEAPENPSEQPELNFELPEKPSETTESPPEQPELIFELPQQPLELPEEPVESAVEQNLENNLVNGSAPSPPNTIVIPGGFVIEIPPDDPEDDGFYGFNTYNEVHPTNIAEDTSSQVKYTSHGYNQFRPVLLHHQTTASNGYHQYGQHPFSNYYPPPTYSPYFAFIAPYRYYGSY